MSIKVKTKSAIVVAAASLAAAATGVAAASSPPITITTPRAGAWISAQRNPYIAVAGGVQFAPSTPQTTRFYLRRAACGTTNDNPHLSVTSAADGGDGCGLIVDSVVGLGGNVDQAAFIDFPATDGMPLALDTSRQISGVIDLKGTAAGVAQVNVSMDALVGGQGVTVGSDSQSAVLDPTASDNAVAFTIQPSTSLIGADLQGLDLRVSISGPSVDAGYIGLSGKSYADLPSFSASINRSVEISLDDPTFSKPVPARLGASGSAWSVAIEAPSPGRHTIYAESTQGFETSKPATTTFTVRR
ncbi:MAG TPA: hypothetical protein VID68_09250 [Solirubrobacteraceae bacterium]|jgi:hypothetical protein